MSEAQMCLDEQMGVYQGPGSPELTWAVSGSSQQNLAQGLINLQLLPVQVVTVSGGSQLETVGLQESVI